MSPDGTGRQCWITRHAGQHGPTWRAKLANMTVRQTSARRPIDPCCPVTARHVSCRKWQLNGWADTTGRHDPTWRSLIVILSCRPVCLGVKRSSLRHLQNSSKKVGCLWVMNVINTISIQILRLFKITRCRSITRRNTTGPPCSVTVEL